MTARSLLAPTAPVALMLVPGCSNVQTLLSPDEKPSTPKRKPTRSQNRRRESTIRTWPVIGRSVGLLVFPLALLAVLLPSFGVTQPPQSVDVTTPKPFRVLQAFKLDAAGTLSISFSPDGRVLAFADDKQVRFYDPHTGKAIIAPWKFESESIVVDVGYVDSKTVAVLVGSADSISVREYPSGKERATLKVDKHEVPTYLATSEGLIVCSGQGSLRTWRGPQWQQLGRAELPNSDSPRALAISPDQSQVAVVTSETHLHVYETKSGKLLHAIGRDKFVPPQVSGVAFSPSGQEIAFAPAAEYADATKFDESDGIAIFDAQLKEHVAIRWKGLNVGRPLGCAFSPDGKTLFVPCRPNIVRIYEVQTGRLRHVGELPGEPWSFALSPDGRLFASGGKSHNNVTVVDWRAGKPGKVVELDQTSLDRLWSDLASSDSARGFQAVVSLAANPTQAAKLIRENLKPISLPDARLVKSLIGDLGSDDFVRRESATKELMKFGELIAPELRSALKDKLAERRERAQRLLTAVERRDSAEWLRALRAVEILEYVDVPASRDVLKQLAAGAIDARLTNDAKAAVARIAAMARKR